MLVLHTQTGVVVYGREANGLTRVPIQTPVRSRCSSPRVLASSIRASVVVVGGSDSSSGSGSGRLDARNTFHGPRLLVMVVGSGS